MTQVVIENPVLNSPYEEPCRHFKFNDEGITSEVAEGRRISCYFMPIPAARKKGKQKGLFDTEWTKDRIEENKFINQVRGKVQVWRMSDYRHITKTSRRLLDYWKREGREKPLFFCQIEALETVIYLTEAASKMGETWIENDLRRFAEDANPGLYRLAIKMATGSGKTVVMAMLIAWQALNKLANPQDPKFSDTFLLVTPGITIRDRLRVLLPNDPANYYRERDILSAEDLAELNKAKVLVTNFHAFRQRERGDAGKLTKAILGSAKTGAFTESPDQMVRRVCRELGNKRNIVVLNDEAHHCYRHRVGGGETEAEKLTGDIRKEAERREEEARVWLSGLEAINAKIGVRAVFDLSATPFYLRGSGWPEGTLFQWVVSDFSLIDAIESGIVKVPRVPVADDSMSGEGPTYRDLWLRIRDELPKKSRREGGVSGEPRLPVELEAAIQSLYSNYEKYYRRWEKSAKATPEKSHTPPVFIVVCNNTNVSKLVFDYLAGWEKLLTKDTTVVVPGKFDLFSNERDRGWAARPNTILVDSEQLESGDAMSADFKKIASVQIEEFRDDYRRRFPGRDADGITDEDILREVMNTVGKPGKLGEGVRCVVSVSMLTEGWDATTVTHILGVRAFGTQLLCEQVVGRALRRRSYTPNDQGMFDPEYAEVYGVPFSFIPSAGSEKDPKPRDPPTRVRALEERIALEITFPRVVGYRYDLPSERLTAKFTEDSRLALSTKDAPTKTEVDPIVGEGEVHTLDGLKEHREQRIAFEIAKRALDRYFTDSDGNARPWLFPQLLQIARRWLSECVTLQDNAFPQMLLLGRNLDDAADKIRTAIAMSQSGEKRLKPILRPYDTVGSTQFVDFDTTRPTYRTRADRCHISHVVADTDSWEQKTAQSIEEMDEVVAYAKNHNLGFTIPYAIDGEERQYIPDFIVRLDDGHGREDPLNLLVEVSGEKKRDKSAKVSTARNLWVPAINNHGAYGRWSFLEISDPWDTKNTIRAVLARGTAASKKET